MSAQISWTDQLDGIAFRELIKACFAAVIEMPDNACPHGPEDNLRSQFGTYFQLQRGAAQSHLFLLEVQGRYQVPGHLSLQLGLLVLRRRRRPLKLGLRQGRRRVRSCLGQPIDGLLDPGATVLQVRDEGGVVELHQTVPPADLQSVFGDPTYLQGADGHIRRDQFHGDLGSQLPREDPFLDQLPPLHDESVEAGGAASGGTADHAGRRDRCE